MNDNFNDYIKSDFIEMNSYFVDTIAKYNKSAVRKIELASNQLSIARACSR